MKNLLSASILSVAMVLIGFSSFAQIRKIPAEVTEALKTKYPDAKNVTWKDKITVFAADFQLADGNYVARFNSKGEWQGSEKEISEADVPAVVKDGLSKSKYADWKTRTFKILFLADDTTKQYFIAISKGDIQKKNLLFAANGQLLKDNITL